MFLTGAIVAFYLTQWSIEWIWGYFATAPSEPVITTSAGVAPLVLAISLYRNDRIYQLATEVAAELSKVTWPTAKEVRAATIVVVVMAVISAIILGTFDLVWSQLTEVVCG